MHMEHNHLLANEKVIKTYKHYNTSNRHNYVGQIISVTKFMVLQRFFKV